MTVPVRTAPLESGPPERAALVTGASSGIGRAVALRLARDGWRLHLSGRDQHRLEELAQQLPSAQVHAGDLSDDSFVQDLTARLPDALGALVHSAGVAVLGPVAQAPVEDLDLHYRVNLRAPYLLTQGLLPALRRGEGRVVFINSGAGNTARANWSQYATSKHALRALANSLREEEPELRVTSIYPGRTASPMQADIHKMEGRPYRAEAFIQPEDVAEEVALALRLPRRASLTDLTIRPA